MLRPALLLLALLALGCEGPPQENALRLVTIDSAESAPGLHLRELPPQVLRSIGLSYGLAVVRTGGVAERAGLKVGDVVHGINQKKIRKLEDFNQVLAQRGEGSLGLLVRRGSRDFYVAVDLAGNAIGPREGMPRGLPPSRETLLRT